MHTNRLVNEKSPYLLQHAHNPVDWYAWGEEAFNKAKAEDKPIFLSIGYSTCHWCHVMEHESFEDEKVATILNRSFVSIKVDREERPDVDRVYMTFVQATTGSGGWPMSVWLTPDLKPFYGGTYFPPDSRYGRPGFSTVLEHLSAAWATDRTRVVESGSNVINELKRLTTIVPSPLVLNEADVRNRLFLHFRRTFDTQFGGFGGAPKFPRPVALNFLFRERAWSKNEEALEMALKTLREMAKGGMYDQIGGGFHRYSVDARWFVPHFEKMLYDQAQLAISYLEAYQITGEKRYADVARDIFEYVLRDLRHPDGAFYSAEDADSVIDPADPKKKGEGAFYIWSEQELIDVLGEKDAAWVSKRFGVEQNGNVREDPHDEFTGRNILYRVDDSEDPPEFAGVREALLLARSKRVRPHLDDKILTSWNSLMISALAKGAQVLGDESYRLAARQARDFIAKKMIITDGILLRRWRDGEAAIPGFLDDYAFFVQALIDLHETDFNDADVELARKLTADMRNLFEDQENGGFFATVEGDEHLVMRMKEDYDGAEPSGNSIAILNLLRLGQIEVAEKALRAFTSHMESQSPSMPQMVIAFAAANRKAQQIVIAGDKKAAHPLIETAHRKFSPFRVLLLNPQDHPEFTAQDGRPAAWVCENFTCQLPVMEATELEHLLT